MTIKKILIPLLCFIVPWSLECAVTNVQKQEAYKKARDAYNDTDIASRFQRSNDVFILENSYMPAMPNANG